MSILRAEGIRKYFRGTGSGIFSRFRLPVKAVDGVDIELARGENLGLVGESGCGKSTLARVLVRLIEPTEGSVYLDGTDFLALRGIKLRRARRRIQMIFQDPYSSLNPRMTIGSTIAEGIRIHRIVKRGEIRRRVHYLLDLVGLSPSDENKYPHEFSGGQRQRVGIARALAVEPEIIVADEPVASLDVSVQAKILNLLVDLSRELDLTILFVSHDLGVVRHICDRVAVMYLGKIVELACREDIFSTPLHPYTKGLLASIPEPVPGKPAGAAIKGEVPSPVNLPPGCPFHPRCPEAMRKCCEERPPLFELGGGRYARCFLME